MPATTSLKVRRGPRHPKSPVAAQGQAGLVYRSGLSATPEGAKKALQRLQEKVCALASVVATHPEMKGRLREIVGSALDVLSLGAPLPWSADLAAVLAMHDGSEDGPLAKVIANPESVAAVKAWLRLAEAEQEARSEVMAAARCWLQRTQLMGCPQ